MQEIAGVAPSGSLGSGYNLEAFRNALAEDPDFIGQDAGSTDMGPYYHGKPATFLPRQTYKHDLAIMLEAARARRIPLIVGSVLTSGCRATLEMGADIITEIAREKGLSFRMAAIDSELDKPELKRRIAKEGELRSLGPEETLTDELIDRCGPICAQMGADPIIRALDEGAEVILAGRACDDAIFAAMPMLKGMDAGLAFHMGKILECAGISAVPCDLAEPMIGRISSDAFTVRPGNAASRCTTVSVAAHSLYERGDPCLQPGPGGMNDLSDSRFEQLDDRSVRVSGSRFAPADRYYVKLEGAEQVGYRSIVLVGIRDAIMISQLDNLLPAARHHAEDRFPPASGSYTLSFRVYGRNAVMGELEPDKSFVPHEIGLLIDVVADTQELANAVAMYVRGHLQHVGYPGIITTAGNLAYPFSPFNVPVGPMYRFSVYHLLPLADPCEIFPMTMTEVRN